MKKTRPILELLLLIGLPAAVLLAGAVTTALAYQNAYTPVAGAERIVGTR